MRNFKEFNFIAKSAIKTGQVVAIDTTNSTEAVRYVFAALSNNSAKGMIIGVAGQGADAGCAINLIPFDVGTVCYVLATEAISKGDKLALDSSGIVDGSDEEDDEVNLPLVALSTASASGDMIAAIVVDNTAQPEAV